MTCGGAFGSGGLGSTPFGSGTTFALAAAVQVRLNAVDVTFTVPPLAVDPASIFDALFPANWTLTGIDPYTATARLAQYCERRDALTVRVFFDGPLTAPAIYALAVNPRVRDAYGVPIAPCSALVFGTFAPERQPAPGVAETLRSDVANPNTLQDAVKVDPPPLGTFQIDDRGDYANETGRAYLRKRVFRRAFTGLGEFFHLPSYGFSEPLKSKITPQLLRRMQARAQAQLLREPDVAAASVSVQALVDAPSIVVVSMRVRDVTGATDSLTVRVDLQNSEIV